MESNFSAILKKWEARGWVNISDEELDEILRMAKEFELQDKIFKKIFYVPNITKPLCLCRNMKNRKYTT